MWAGVDMPFRVAKTSSKRKLPPIVLKKVMVYGVRA